jgi:LPXTG-site transpeptidase (sortase) family protein
MNQILYTGDLNKNKYSKMKKIFKIQFFSSCILIIAIILIYAIYSNFRNSEEIISQKILSTYNITKLYSNENSETNSNTIYESNGIQFSVIGIIEIPKLNISYPILSESNDELLKIAPCRLSGPMPNEDGNLCIAGHNYDNSKFFSKISSLANNDEIKIYNINGSVASYYVFEISEVNEDDLTPLEISSGIKKEVTLITCNNLNNRRIIVKAKFTN